jgi:predicted dehydrogenase
VFLEKPMADTLEECDRMLAAVERAGVQLLVAHSQRYFASTIRAREIIRSGQLGEPVFATDTWYKNFGYDSRLPWFLDRATGGGMWLMNGAHMIDRTCWVLDTQVESVRAWIGSPFHHLPADDAIIAFLKLRNGLHASLVHAGYKTRGVDKCEVEITCTNGMLKFDSYSNRLATDQDGAYVPIELQRAEPFGEELKNLIGAINGTEPLKVTPAWGRHIVEVLLAAEESSRTGREVPIRSRGNLLACRRTGSSPVCTAREHRRARPARTLSGWQPFLPNSCGARQRPPTRSRALCQRTGVASRSGIVFRILQALS